MTDRIKRMSIALEQLHSAVRSMIHAVDNVQSPEREVLQFMLYQAQLRLIGETADDMTQAQIIGAECDYNSEVLGVRYLPLEKIQ